MSYDLQIGSSQIQMLLIGGKPDDVALLRHIVEEQMSHNLSISINSICNNDLASAIPEAATTAYDLILLDDSLFDGQIVNTPRANSQYFKIQYFDSPEHTMIAQLRAVVGETPIIVLASLDKKQWAQTAVQAGAQDYLIKDELNSHLFIRTVRYVMERQQMAKTLLQERAQLAQQVATQTAELRLANSQLLRNARLKDEFLATVSHELRTPLSVILTLSEAIEDSIYGDLNEQQQKAIKRIRKSGRHLLALINDILDVSKIESGTFELEIGPVSIPTLCEDCLQMIQEMATQKHHRLITKIDPTVKILYADGRRLMQALLNLLNNAVKFTPDGGTIELAVTGQQENEQIIITVRDTGIGIKDSDIAKLFQPFVQLDSRLSRNYQGAGLGLALVYRLVKLHGGTVSVTSEPQQGSCFSVQLPWRLKPACSLS